MGAAAIMSVAPHDTNASTSPLLRLPTEVLDMICGYVSLVITLTYNLRKTHSQPTSSTVFVRIYSFRFDCADTVAVANDRRSSYAPQI